MDSYRLSVRSVASGIAALTLVAILACTPEPGPTATVAPTDTPPPATATTAPTPTATPQPTATPTPSPTPTPTPTSTPIPTATATPVPSLADVIESIRPAVVSIGIGVKADDFLVDRIERHLGSGFLYEPTGLILTNFHVIVDSEDILVGVPRPFGGAPVIYPATVVGSDAESDLAVLKIEPPSGEEFPFLPLDPVGEIRVGDTVVALGYPIDENLNPTLTATQGGVSSVRTDGQDIIQHQASVNPGNSGGPLIDVDGRITGVNTFVVRSFGFTPIEGFNGAIGIGEVLDRIERLESGELFEVNSYVSSDIYEYNIRLPFGWEVLEQDDLGFRIEGAGGSIITVSMTPSIPEELTEQQWVENLITTLDQGIEPDEFFDESQVQEIGGLFTGVVQGTVTEDGVETFVQHSVTAFNRGGIELRLESGSESFFGLFEAFEVIALLFPNGWIQHLSESEIQNVANLRVMLTSVAVGSSFDFERPGDNGEANLFRINAPEPFHRLALVQMNFNQLIQLSGETEVRPDMIQLVLETGRVLDPLDTSGLIFPVEEEFFDEFSVVEEPVFEYGSKTLPRTDWVPVDFLFQIPKGVDPVEVRWLQSGLHVFSVD